MCHPCLYYFSKWIRIEEQVLGSSEKEEKNYSESHCVVQNFESMFKRELTRRLSNSAS